MRKLPKEVEEYLVKNNEMIIKSNDFHFLFLDEETQNNIWNIRLTELSNNTDNSQNNIETDLFKPVILFSYDSREVYYTLNPNQSILYSPGVYWKHLPDDIKFDTNQLFNPNSNNLKNFLNNIKRDKIKRIEKVFKHDLASEFGALLFANELQKAKKIKSETVANISNIFENLIKNEKRAELKNYFVLKDFKINKKGNTNSNNDSNLSEKLELNVLHIDDKTKNGWEFIFSDLFTELSTFKNDVQFNLYLDDLIEEKKNYLPFDLIILDLNLHAEDSNIPIIDKSGYKVLKRIRDFDLLIPVIMFTGSEKTVNMNKLNSLGIEAFISKPHPGMNDFDLNNHIINFLSVNKKVSDSKFLHNIWKVYRILKNKLQLNGCENSIFDKLKTIVLKFHSISFSKSDFSKKLQGYEYNEILLYLHSIMTDVIIGGLDNYRITDDNNSKVFKDWNDYISDKDFGNNAKPGFQQKWINDYNFTNKDEKKILRIFNFNRNQIKPIHGDIVIGRYEALSFFCLIIYEIVKDNKELYNDVLPLITGILNKIELYIDNLKKEKELPSTIRYLIRSIFPNVKELWKKLSD